MTLLFVVNATDFFISHRLSIALAARDAGFEVHVATGDRDESCEISAHGLTHHLIPLSRSGRNVFAELRSIFFLIFLIQKLKPDLLHLVTIKPVIYGGVAARFSRRIAVISAVSGLGTAFVDRGAKFSLFRRFLEMLFGIALGGPNTHVIFQNEDDRRALRSVGALSNASTSIIKGSGVDLNKYSFKAEPLGTPIVTFAARLLADKGAREFYAAAHLLRSRGVAARFWVVGATDPENLTSISEDELGAWGDTGVVEVLGFCQDMQSIFSRSNVIVLPSYREGLPKVLIEAAACGRAIVTTDVPGCRDAIIPYETGLLVPMRNVNALADAIQSLVENPELRKMMGSAGRTLAEHEYGIERVIDAHLSVYWETLSRSGRH